MQNNLVKQMFWVVFSPTANSDINDLVIGVDIKTLAKGMAAGVDAQRVVGLFIDEKSATQMASFLLKEKKNQVVRNE